jgi:hypothetical protein
MITVTKRMRYFSLLIQNEPSILLHSLKMVSKGTVAQDFLVTLMPFGSIIHGKLKFENISRRKKLEFENLMLQFL